MTQLVQETEIKEKSDNIWCLINSLKEKPVYPAIVQKLLITAHEEEYFDHDLTYEEKYTEWLELREGLIVSQIEDKSNLLGVGDAIILDFAKHALLRAPRVTRCGLILPLLSQQGYTAQPKDTLTYYGVILAQISAYQQSAFKKSLRC